MGIVFKQVEVREHCELTMLPWQDTGVEGQMVARTEAGGHYEGGHRGGEG